MFYLVLPTDQVALEVSSSNPGSSCGGELALGGSPLHARGEMDGQGTEVGDKQCWGAPGWAL